MDWKRLSTDTVTRPDDACAKWRGWLEWIDEQVEGLPTIRREMEDAASFSSRAIQGTVVSLQGRYPSKSTRFRFEQIGLIDAHAPRLLSLPVAETAQIPSTLSLGSRVKATVRNGSVVLVKSMAGEPRERDREERAGDE